MLSGRPGNESYDTVDQINDVNLGQEIQGSDGDWRNPDGNSQPGGRQQGVVAVRPGKEVRTWEGKVIY